VKYLEEIGFRQKIIESGGFFCFFLFSLFLFHLSLSLRNVSGRVRQAWLAFSLPLQAC
jgi:hypothetical protein